MQTASFFIKDALGFGWAMVKEKFWFLVLLLLVSGFFSMLPDIINMFTHNKGVSFVVQAASFVVGFVIDAGLIAIMLKLHDGREAKAVDVFSQYPIVFQYFVATVLYSLMVILGFLLLIVPGVYLALRYQFYAYFVVDKRTDILDSFSRSAAITEGHKWHLLHFWAALLGVNLLGLLALGIGLFATVPLSMLATAFVYRKLSSPVSETETDQEVEEVELILNSIGDGNNPKGEAAAPMKPEEI